MGAGSSHRFHASPAECVAGFVAGSCASPPGPSQFFSCFFVFASGVGSSVRSTSFFWTCMNSFGWSARHSFKKAGFVVSSQSVAINRLALFGVRPSVANLEAVEVGPGEPLLLLHAADDDSWGDADLTREGRHQLRAETPPVLHR
jgi:hypothetical protein